MSVVLMKYILEVNEKNKKVYKMFFRKNINLWSNDLRIIEECEDGTYEIVNFRYLNRVAQTTSEYNNMLKLSNRYLGIEIGADDAEKLSGKAKVQVFDNMFKSKQYKRLDNLDDKYYLLNVKFKNKLDLEQYFKIVVINSGGDNYIIEPCSNKENLQMQLLDSRLKRNNLFSGIYLSVDIDDIDESLLEYISTISRDKDYFYQLDHCPMHIMPYMGSDNMAIKRSLDYLSLIYDSRQVYYRNTGNGYKVYPVEKYGNLTKKGYKLGYLINNYTYYEYINKTHNPVIQDIIIHLNMEKSEIFESEKNIKSIS